MWHNANPPRCYPLTFTFNARVNGTENITWPTFSFKRTLSLSQVLVAEVREREDSIWRCWEGSWARFLCRTWHWQCTKSGNFRWRRDCGDLRARDTMRRSRSQLADLQLLRNCYLIYWFGNRKQLANRLFDIKVF